MKDTIDLAIELALKVTSDYRGNTIYAGTASNDSTVIIVDKLYQDKIDTYLVHTGLSCSKGYTVEKGPEPISSSTTAF